MSLIAVDGDTVTQEGAHPDGDGNVFGAGTYPITPITLQNFVYINNKLLVVNGQTYEAHGTATCIASSSLVYIAGKAVVRDKDYVEHHHANTGVNCIQQNFVNDNS